MRTRKPPSIYNEGFPRPPVRRTAFLFFHHFFPKEAERFLSAPSREFSMEVERINQIQNMTEDLRQRLIELRRYL